MPFNGLDTAAVSRASMSAIFLFALQGRVQGLGLRGRTCMLQLRVWGSWAGSACCTSGSRVHGQDLHVRV